MYVDTKCQLVDFYIVDSWVDFDIVDTMPRLRAHHTSSSKERMTQNKEFVVHKPVWFKLVK